MDDNANVNKIPAVGASEDWREIAEEASREADPEKLLKLIQKLCDKLEERDAGRKPKSA